MTDQRNDVINRFRAFLESKHELRAAWLIGSYGRGDADAYSDIDIIACVDTTDKVEQVFNGLINELKKDPQIVFLKTISHSHTINTINEDWDRCDISVIHQGELGSLNKSEVKVLFDKNDLTSMIPDEPKSPINVARELQNNTEEFIRILGLLPVVIGREENVVAQSGVFVLKNHLIRLMKLEKGDSRGALSLKKSLSQKQYDILDKLPVINTEPDSIIQGHVYLARAFLPLARKMYAQQGLSWPQAFEDATLKNLQKKLHLKI